MAPSTKKRKASAVRVTSPASHSPPAGMPIHSTALPTQMNTARRPAAMDSRSSESEAPRRHLITLISGWVASSVWVKT